MSPDIDTSMSLASIPGSSAEILYTFSSSLMSIAGAVKLNETAGRHAGSTSNMRRSEGKPKPLLNRSNRRSISLRKECHTSGTFVCAGATFFTSTGTSDIAVSIVHSEGSGTERFGHHPIEGGSVGRLHMLRAGVIHRVHDHPQQWQGFKRRKKAADCQPITRRPDPEIVMPEAEDPGAEDERYFDVKPCLDDPA